MTNDDIDIRVAALHPSLLRFLQDLSNEELLYLRQQATEQYSSIHVDTTGGKLRAIRSLTVVDKPKYSNNREEREIAGIKKLFGEFNKFAGLSDKEMAQLADDELWAFQSIYSREAAMLESIIDRLMRSEHGGIKPVTADILQQMIDALK